MILSDGMVTDERRQCGHGNCEPSLVGHWLAKVNRESVYKRMHQTFAEKSSLQTETVRP